MNIKELISSVEVELEAAQKRQQKADAEIKLILETAKQEGRAALTEEESARTDQLFENIELAKAQENGIKDKLARAKKIEAEEADYEARASQTTPTVLPNRKTGERRTASVSVMGEARTYTRESDPTGAQFLRDVVMGTVYREVGASDRLSRHMAEERVERGAFVERAGDIATSGMGGLVVPQFLVEMTAPAVANLRPFADACNHHTLPDSGMSVTIPTVSGGTAAAIQTENAAVQDTALTETDLTFSVKTAAGQQSVSRQAIERGTGIGEVVLQDLFKRYATVLDNELINGATTGLKAKSVVNTYTSGSPTAGEHYQNIMGSASKVEKALLAMGKPNLVVMHGRRWYWLQSQLVSTWPFVSPGPGPGGVGQSVGGANGQPYGSPSRGYLPNGMTVVIDDNIVTNLGVGTNQDQIYVTCSDECHLWEADGQPTFIRAEQPLANQLSILLVVYGYFAYTFARYSGSVQALDGTGLVAPTGF